jgi:predicted ATPase
MFSASRCWGNSKFGGNTDQLLEHLWPTLPPSKAQKNLWVTVSQIRRILQPDSPPRTRSDFIHKQGEGYRFNSESNYWLDVDLFTKHLISAQSAVDLTGRISVWEEARVLYQGEYLEDQPYAEWAQLPRSQWRRRYEQLLINLANAYQRSGNLQESIALCREILTLDNTNETALRLLMRNHASLGERGRAIKVYDEVANDLEKEIGVNPTRETAELARQIQSSEETWIVEEEDWTTSSQQASITHPLVGRGNEVSQLTRLLTRTAAGQGQTVLISGEPGIGKSRLVQVASVIARKQGFNLLSAQCYQVERSIPYQALIELIRQMIPLNVRWQQLASVWLRELAILVPEMGEPGVTAPAVAPQSDEPEESRQARLIQAIFHLFANQTDQSKFLLVVEDIQWADPTTLQCLHYISRQIVRFPIGLIFTVREESISTDADLVALIQSLQRENNVTPLSLARLSETNAIELLSEITETATYASWLGPWFHKETEGNPFFFISLLQTLRDDGLLDNATEENWQALSRVDPTLTLPDAIRDSVRDRLQRLSQSEREVLDWMAVYDRHLDFSTLQIISNQPQMTLLNSVEQLTGRQLLAETTGQYEFIHHKIREVVYHDLSAARRGLYHRQIAEMLNASSPSPDEMALLAHHFEHGGEEEKAIIYWMRAGEHALATYAYQLAARHYERALALSDKPTPQMDAYLGLGNAFILLDDHKAATAVLQQGLRLSEHHGEDVRRTRLLYAQALNASRQHRSDGGRPEVEAALAAAELAGDENYIVQCLLLLTEVHESCGDLSSALETATRAQIVSSKLKNYQLEARAQVEIGFLHAQRADFNEAVSAAELGLKLLAETDDLNTTAYAWNILGRALSGRGDYGRALNAFQLSQEEAKKVCDRYLLAQLHNMYGWLHHELGDYENALKFNEDGVEFAQQCGKPSPEISARLNVCLDLLQLGDPERALELLNKIEAQINAGSFGFHGWRWRMRLLHARGLCLLALKEPNEALMLAEEGVHLAAKHGIRKYVVLNHELKSKVLTNLGRVDEAIEVSKAAITLADEIQYQPIRWESRQQLAELYHQKGRGQEAKKRTSEAKHIIETIATSIEDENLRAAFVKKALPQMSNSRNV